MRVVLDHQLNLAPPWAIHVHVKASLACGTSILAALSGFLETLTAHSCPYATGRPSRVDKRSASTNDDCLFSIPLLRFAQPQHKPIRLATNSGIKDNQAMIVVRVAQHLTLGFDNKARIGNRFDNQVLMNSV